MAEIKDPKRYYYAMRSRYMRELKQIGHKLSLAVTDEEDALQWEKYKTVIMRWRDLEIPEGVKQGTNTVLKTHVFWKPKFNDEYVELTIELKGLYAKMNRAKSKQERYDLEDEIRALKNKRSSVTTYIDRETGEAYSPSKQTTSEKHSVN